MVTASTKTSKPGSNDERSPLVSKTQRKRDMLALQSLGESLIGIARTRLSQLDLPEVLFDAIVAAETVTARGARARQLQYIGRLMRDIDPEPIRRQLDLWAQSADRQDATGKLAEEWRERLIADSTKIDELIKLCPGLDRKALRRLVETANRERSRGHPPAAYRRLFRLLRDALSTTSPPTDSEI